MKHKHILQFRDVSMCLYLCLWG